MKRQLLISAAILALSVGGAMAADNVATITQVGATDIIAEQT